MMAIQSRTATIPPLRRVAALAALSVATLACGGPMAASAPAGQAEGRAAPSRPRYSAEHYPLDEATVRKVGAVIRAWTPPEPELPKRRAEGVVDAMQMAIESTFTTHVAKDLKADSTATIDATPPLKAAIVQQGLSSRTFAEALLAVQAASFAIGMEHALQGAAPDPALETPPTLKANVELVRRMRAEGVLPAHWW
jgi:hypothetical protein